MAYTYNIFDEKIIMQKAMYQYFINSRMNLYSTSSTDIYYSEEDRQRIKLKKLFKDEDIDNVFI